MPKKQTKKGRKTKSKAGKETRGFFKFKALDGKKYKLTLKEKKFSELYLEFSGNGVQAALDAFEITGKNAYQNAKSMAYEYLTKPHLIAYITLKLEEYGYTDDNIDKQNLFLINQFSSLQAKARGIEIYNKQKGRNAPEKHKVEHSFSLSDLLDKAGDDK